MCAPVRQIINARPPLTGYTMRVFFLTLGAIFTFLTAYGTTPVKDDEKVIGVIVGSETNSLLPQHWALLKQLSAVPEIHYVPKNLPGPGAGLAFDFSGLRRELELYSDHGLRQVAVTLAPHFISIPALPQVDETGKIWAERHNPFDPAFIAELERMNNAFGAGPMRDQRIARVYVAPPSFYGEGEYFMGDNWFNLHFLMYDAQARARFLEWLRGHYDSPQAVGRAWGRTVADWDSITLPRPPTVPSEILAGHVNDWIDLLEWRTDYLTHLTAQAIKLIASGGDQDVGFKVAWGDTSAFHGTDTAGIFSRLTGLKNLVLHSTDAHGAADLAYAAGIVRRYHLRRLIAENDGNRYGRTELAKVLLNCLMAGVDSYNFSYIDHLADRAAEPTETFRALVSARAALLEYRYDLPSMHSIAFLHSNTTRDFRAPKYFNKDVQLVYDSLLHSERPYHWWCYSWARSLGMPDVTGEQLILDGDLERRRMVIVPNTSTTVLPAGVRERVMKWIEGGGTLVAFGSEAIAWQLEPAGIDVSHSRIRRVLDFTDPGSEMSHGSVHATPAGKDIFDRAPWALPDTPAPVWRESLPDPWESLLADARGQAALARKKIGRGAILLFPGPVPELAEPQEPPPDPSSHQMPKLAAFRDNPYYRQNVPLILRAVAEASGCAFAFQMFGTEAAAQRPVVPLAVKYLGRDIKDGTHTFVAGANDHSMARLRFEPAAALSGKARILLVDMLHVAATYTTGNGSPTIRSNYPTNGKVYLDPTNEERDANCLIPITGIEFEANRPLFLQLTPR